MSRLARSSKAASRRVLGKGDVFCLASVVLVTTHCCGCSSDSTGVADDTPQDVPASSASPTTTTTVGNLRHTPAPTPAPTPPPTTTTTTTPSTQLRWPYDIMQCPGQAVTSTANMTCAGYDLVASSVRALYNSLPSNCTAQNCPQADFAGCVLRLAGHDLMDYQNMQGGSDGCLDMQDVDNRGLAGCLYSGEHGVSLLSAYQQHCSWVSLADFIVISAEAVMDLSREHVLQDQPSRGRLDFRTHFKYGRTTAQTCEWAVGRLPNPERSCTAVRETFVDRMGLDWAGAAALMGVHSLGRARPENSGYNGFWSDAENSRRFNNDYYASMLGKGWMAEQAVGGNPDKNQWFRSDDGANEQVLGKEMMLDTDLCLAYTGDPRGSIELSSASRSCCAWASFDVAETAVNNYLGGEYCGRSTSIPAREADQRRICCDGQQSIGVDCTNPNALRGPAESSVRLFASSETDWLSAFQSAWTLATENGWSGLRNLDECAATP